MLTPGRRWSSSKDVHWADEATLDLLRFLGRRLGSTRAFLLATYRDDEIGLTHPLRVAFGDLATLADTVHRLVLPRCRCACPDTRRRERARSGCALPADWWNPFFVTEVLAAGGQGLPTTVRDAVLGRVARLSPTGRAILAVAAVIGTRIEPWLLAEIVEHGATV